MVNHKRKKKKNVDKAWRGEGGGQPMWIPIKFYDIIIKSANMDKGGRVNAHLQNVVKKTCFFNPLLRTQFFGLCLDPSIVMGQGVSWVYFRCILYIAQWYLMLKVVQPTNKIV